MNTQLEQLQAERSRLHQELEAAILRQGEIGAAIDRVEGQIRGLVHGDDRRLVLARIEDRQRAAAEADQAQRAANAAALSAHRLRVDGETEAGRAERLRIQQNRIDAENERERREEENRRRRLAALRG